MTNSYSWLQVLDQSTSYEDLQQIFTQIAVEADSTNDPTGLANAIDQAIARIERERERDSILLRNLSSDYDDFKERQAGVIGWLKRKMPFTETRRKELEHRENLTEQQAEVLADNFVIARAQMLKERLLSPPSRKLGLRTSDWQSRLLGQQDVKTVREYGASVLELNNELVRIDQFIDLVKVDITAFSGAAFAEKESKKRRDLDIAAATNELQAIISELKQKQSFLENAKNNLLRLFIDDLSISQPEFDSLRAKSRQLRMAASSSNTLSKLSSERVSLFKTIAKSIDEDQELINLREKSDVQWKNLTTELRNLETTKQATSRELQEPQRVFQAVQAEVQHARSELMAAKRLYDAYQIEQNSSSGNAEVSGSFPFDGSPVVSEFVRTEEALKQVESKLNGVSTAYETAKRKDDQISNQILEVQSKIDTNQKERQKLDTKEEELKRIIEHGYKKLERLTADFESRTTDFSRAIREISWLPESTSLTAIRSYETSNRFGRSVGLSGRTFGRTEDSSAKIRQQSEFQRERDDAEKFDRELNGEMRLLDDAFKRIERDLREKVQKRSIQLVNGDVVGLLDFDRVMDLME